MSTRKSTSLLASAAMAALALGSTRAEASPAPPPVIVVAPPPPGRLPPNIGMARGQIAPTSSHVHAGHAVHVHAAPLVNATWRMADALQRLSPTAAQALATSSTGRHLSLVMPPMMFRRPWTELHLSPPNVQILSLPSLRLGYSKTHAFSFAFALPVPVPVAPLGR